MERLDLYLRLEYHTKDIAKEFQKLGNWLEKSGITENTRKMDRLKAILDKEESWKDHYFEALDCLRGVVQVI